MKNLFKATLVVLGVAGWTQWALAAGDAANGEALSSTCAACHGADGNSASPMFPKIAGLGEKYLFEQLVAIQNMNGEDEKGPQRMVPEMAGILDGMSEQDLRDLAAYYDSQSMQISGATEGQVQLYTGNQVDALKLGEQVYRAGNHETNVPACTGCHSPTGNGNDPAGYPRLGGQYADYIAKQLRDFRAGNRTTDGEAMVMRGVAKNMSDAEIDAVANYISGLN